MDFEFACVYNPELGDESCIEKQIVWTDNQLSLDEYLSVIGIAQGVAELAYSFDGKAPAKWLDKGTHPQKRVYIVPLSSDNIENVELNADGDVESSHKSFSQNNWRSGYWFCAQEVITQSSWPPLAVYNSVIAAFRQYNLMHNLATPSDFAKLDLNSHFYLNSTTAICPNSLRMAPGMLSPSTKSEIIRLTESNAVVDILITLKNGACVYSGLSNNTEINTTTKIAIQNWLADLHRKSNSNTSSNDKWNWDALKAAIPSMPVMTRPIPTIKQMASIASLSSYIWGTESPTTETNNKPEQEESEVQKPLEEPTNSSMEVRETIFVGGKKYTIVVYHKNLYTYAIICNETSKPDLYHLFESLAESIEGFCFAFAPPVGFQFLVNDSVTAQCTSTLSDTLHPSILTSLCSGFEGNEQIIRTHKHWLICKRLSTSKYAVVVKKCDESTALLGVHTEVLEWLDGLRHV